MYNIDHTQCPVAKVFLDNQNTTKKIRELIMQQTGLRLAVASWGEDAMNILGINKYTEAKIICNLDRDWTNPDEIKKLLKCPRIEIRTLSNLHSKVYLGSNAAVIGSSNASLYGLDFPDEESNKRTWIEANYLVSDSEQLRKIRTWFWKHWKDGDEITNDDIKMARKKWRGRDKPRNVSTESEDLAF